MKFLIVEDSKMSRMLIKKALKQYGYTDFIETENGEDALEMINDVDFIITDINMPIMHGYELIKRVPVDNKTIPILVVSTNKADQDVEEAIRCGANGYVVKPFFPEHLKQSIDAILSKSTTE